MRLELKQVIDFYIGGVALFIIKPFVFLIGRISKRNHKLEIRENICFLKMLGGGSLVVAYPSILALKKKYPNKKFILITTKTTLSFSEVLEIFDKIYTIDDTNIFTLLISSLKVFWHVFGKIDTIIDLEIYSRLSTLFCLFTLARNRIAFYFSTVFFKRYISTHLLYFNKQAGIFVFYEQIAKIFGTELLPDTEVKNIFLEQISKDKIFTKNPKKTIGIGHACSDLAPERMLKKEHWKKVFLNKFDKNADFICCFFGSKNDKKSAQEIIDFLSLELKNIEFKNMCGKLKLRESIQYISICDEFFCVDSGLLHFARLMGIKTTSFWGPTDPSHLLKKFSYLDEEVYYKKTFCSPCTHNIIKTPCQGKNICIDVLFSENERISDAVWIYGGNYK